MWSSHRNRQLVICDRPPPLVGPVEGAAIDLIIFHKARAWKITYELATAASLLSFYEVDPPTCMWSSHRNLQLVICDRPPPLVGPVEGAATDLIIFHKAQAWKITYEIATAVSLPNATLLPFLFHSLARTPLQLSPSSARPLHLFFCESTG
ncbi:hypothetical protein MRB53_026059 [Persea americana]|uniref:Uncharacterized protein n=2 Tax=Persea americana TaxID=3435 RepID=A0ACC2LHS3_PERAE|nr:hypothetical protein MRB53_026054 [Persea americana]KAJ8632723.1 hypothetical protein MRB53_026059 [Persea americana]